MMNENKQNNLDGIEQQNEISSPIKGSYRQQPSLQNIESKKKKKCRGNRNAQRRRRKLRQQDITVNNTTNEQVKSTLIREHNEEREIRQQLNDPNTDEDISNVNKSFIQISLPDYNKDNISANALQHSMKRKQTTNKTNKSMCTIHKSLSELSTLESSRKKQKIVTDLTCFKNSKTRLKITEEKSKKLKQKSVGNEQHNKINQTNSYIPNYLKVSNHLFRQMLMNSLEHVDTIVHQLNTNEKLDFIRQHACLLHRLFYVQLQEDQWKYYHDIGIKENIWSGRVSKKWATMNCMYYTYGRSKQLIEQRLKTIERQLYEASQALKNFTDQPLPLFMLEMNPPLDLTKISAMITSIVRKGQHKLRQQFEYNKKILMFDSMDHRLVHQVYELKPNQQQIRYIRNYWKAIYNKAQMEEQIELLKYQIHSNYLPPALNLLDNTLDHIHQILTHTKSPSINKHTQTVLTGRRLKKIGRFKYDLLELSIAASEEKIRYWNQIAEKEKSKLLKKLEKLTSYNKLNSNLFDSFINAIEARKQHMIKRISYITKEKLKSFFDMAPTSQNTTLNNDGVGVNHQ